MVEGRRGLARGVVRIGVDVTAWGRYRGAARVRRNLVRALVELDDRCEWVLFADPDDPPDLRAGVEIRVTRLSRAAGRPSRLDLLRQGRRVRAAGLDAFVFPTTRNWFPVPRVPTVVGVFDTIGYSMPSAHFKGPAAAAAWRVKQRLAVRWARSIFTISEHARREVADWFGIPAESVVVVPCAPDPALAPPAADEMERALGELGLSRDGFVLYSAAINRRKAIETLVAAHARAAAAADFPLVIVGVLSSYPGYVAELRELAARGGRRVLFAGYVPDPVLASLYAGAAVSVTPSLAEGFGLPVVEAAAAGAAVVASDIPSHRESLGDGAKFFTPGSVDELTRVLDELLGDEALRRERGRAAHAAASRLSWRDAAARLEELAVSAAST
jgi:alpha-1,3-rhamnosyl/mannosyltransferase